MSSPTSRQPQPRSAIFAQLAKEVAQIFEQTQNSRVANDIKHHVALYGIHSRYAKHIVELNKGRQKQIGEIKFLKAVQDMIQRYLPMKKGIASADRAVKFISGYIKYANEKCINEKVPDEEDEDEEAQLGPRFTARLLNYLLTGFLAKDKNIRYRALQLVAGMTCYLGEIEEDLYIDLLTALIGRTTDRESNVRTQAILSLANLETLFPSEDISEPNEQPSKLEVLHDSLAHDPSADVRRAVLYSLPKTSQSLPAILDRIRDTDASVRKGVYSHALLFDIATKDGKNPNAFEPTHPRTLTISQRELIVRNGLGDREPSVKAAARTLISKWMDVAGTDTKGEEMDVKVNDIVEKTWETSIPAFLTLFDLMEGTIAVEALLSVFTTKAEIFEQIDFNDQYWRNLTPEKAFLARVFVEHCRSTKDEARLETKLPVVTEIAYRIQDAFGMLSEDSVTEMADATDEETDEDKRDRLEDERISREVIVSELLKLALHLDYSDETGRRKTLQLVRDMLKTEGLPESLMAPCLDVLRTLAPSERDLIMLVVEAVGELRDAVYKDEFDTEEAGEIDADTSIVEENPTQVRKSREEMSAEQAMQIDQVDLRCLDICIEMLGRVNSTFEENITLEGVLKSLIFPAVERTDSIILREKGWKSLGLCCMIHKRLALKYFGQVIRCVMSSSGALKTTAIQSLFDIVMVHKNAIFNNNEDGVTLKIFTDLILNQILTEQDPKFKALFCMGTTKLVILGTITSVEAVKVLIKVYLSPLTSGNQELRQWLSNFFPAYSYASRENQKRMCDIFIQVFLDVGEDRKINEDREEIIGSSKVADMFAEWTDPLRLDLAIDMRGIQNSDRGDDSVQLGMAENVIRLLFGKGLMTDILKEDKKVLCQLLNKLHIPDVVDDYRIRSLKILMDNLRTRRPLRDKVCLNAFDKFEATITKKFEKQLEGLTEMELRDLEGLTELFEFLDSVVPLDDDEYLEVEPPKKGKKRRSNSFTTNESRPGSPVQRGKSKTKRPRLSKSDNEDDISEGGSAPPPKVPRRTVPRRAAAPTKFTPVIVISSDSEDDLPPKVAHNSGTRFRTAVKEEPTKDDQDLISGASSLSLGEVTYDSIMDPDSEDEEDEVNDLLADSE